MLKRILPLLVALAVAGTPVALLACQLTCESAHPVLAHDAHSHASHQHAEHSSCHEVPATPHHVSPQTHRCHHQRGTTTSIAAARNSDTAVPALIALPTTDGFAFVRTPMLVPVLQSSLPDRIQICLASPLRI